MIDIIYGEDKQKAYSTDIVYRWDEGQKIRIKGLTLPETVRVDFALSYGDAKALSVIGTDDGEGIVAPIPNILLGEKGAIRNYIIRGWIYVTDEEEGETVAEFEIPITARPMPELYDPSEDEKSILQELMSEVQKKVERVRLTSEGDVLIYEDRPLYYDELIEIMHDETKYVTLNYNDTIPCQLSAWDGAAVWFESVYIVDDIPYMFRLIINSDDEIKTTELELVAR